MINDALEQFFVKYSVITDQDKLAIAVSGGPDSMALAHALVTRCPDKNFHIVSVNHGLRTEAVSEIEGVQKWCADFPHVAFQSLDWGGEKPETGVMEAARAARYALINEYCQQHGIETLFVAHHQDDQAETFWIRLSKGSGLDGLSGMASVSYQGELVIARPFLDIAKKDIITYCDAHNIPYVQDPSNENGRYLRPRLREARGILEAEGLTSKRLAKTSQRLQRASDALHALTDRVVKDACREKGDGSCSFDVDVLMEWPDEITLRVLKKVMESFQPEKEYGTRLERIEDLHASFISAYNQKEDMKKRSLGHCFFSYSARGNLLKIEKE